MPLKCRPTRLAVWTREGKGMGSRTTGVTSFARVACALTLFVLTALTGCASGPPTAEELANADNGTPISQSDAQSRAQSWVMTQLKDPLSAQCNWGPVQRGWTRGAPIEGGSLYFGYRMEASINAKNSFGGYVGFKPYVFMFKNGDLEHV